MKSLMEMKGLGERLPPKVLDHCLHLAQDLLPLLFLGTLFCVMLNINVKYKWNTNSCGSYLHVIMTLRPTALHSCPYGLILSFSLSRPASSMVGFWQLLLLYSYRNLCLDVSLLVPSPELGGM